MLGNGFDLDKLSKISSIVTPLDRPNVDTDQIVPKQFLKLVQRTGFGKFLFHDWRFDQNNNPKNDFVLNNPKYFGSHILVSGDNFGCGSSREHAAWAIKDYGFDVVIAPSFADIFYNNCFKNGILPIRVNEQQLAKLMTEISANEGVQFTVDLANQSVTTPGGNGFSFDIDPFRKGNLLSGLDDIGLTLQHVDKITEYESRHKIKYPWLWA